MNKLKALSLLKERQGMLFHLLSSIVVFSLWRITGMPSPGILGRLIPISWMIAAIVFGKGGIPRLSLYIMVVFVLLSFFWAVSPAVEVISAACAFAGIFPGLLAISSRKFGILLASLPILPMVLILIPFTGDEPHYASITENLISPEAELFSSYERQSGDPEGGFTHHQSFYPALMIPGYPLAVPGLRGMNILFALAALAAMLAVFRDTGVPDWRRLTVLGFLLIPGSALLGLVYPGWLSLAVFLSAVYTAINYRSRIWIIIAALFLVLIKFRFSGISIGLLAALVIETKGRKKLILPVIFACLAAVGLLFDLLLLDGRIFWVRYGNTAFLSTILHQYVYRAHEILLAVSSTLVDIESGLLWKAPWVLAAVAGLPLLKRRNGRLFLWLGLPALFYYVLLIFWAIGDWSGIPTPSGRMLLPLLPVLLASLGYMLKRREVRILVWISLGISALMFVYPLFRFNCADGTDVLLSSIAGSASNVYELLPSAVRFNFSVFASWTAFSVLLIVMLARGSRYFSWALASAAMLLCLWGGMNRISWEGEDIPSEYRQFCSYYPETREYDLRKFWFFSREMMLRLSSPDDAIILPLNGTPGDTLKLTVMHRSLQDGPPAGIAASSGHWSDSVYSCSEAMAVPSWITSLKDTQLPPRPENLREISSVFLIPVTDGTDSVVLTPLGMDGEHGRFHGVYVDRITIR
jgi:hypothetical protein